MQTNAIAVRVGNWLEDICKNNEATFKEHASNVQKAFYSYFQESTAYTDGNTVWGDNSGCIRQISVITNDVGVQGAADLALASGGGMLRYTVWNEGSFLCERLAINSTETLSCNSPPFQASLLSKACNIKLLENTTIVLPSVLQSGSTTISDSLTQPLGIGVLTIAIYKGVKNLTTGHPAYGAAWLVAGVAFASRLFM